MAAAERGLNVIASDVGVHVINTHLAVRQNAGAVIDLHSAIAQLHLGGSFSYGSARDLCNGIEWGGLNDGPKAALLLFLNRAGFNGLWRFNQSGGFNSPEGKHPKLAARLLRTRDIVKASALLQRLTLFGGDAFKVLESVQPGDCVYLDPPYYPRTPTEFQGYGSLQNWGPPMQAALAAVARALVAQGSFVIASNHDLPEVRALWDGFDFLEITSERDSVNVSSTGRGIRRELLMLGGFE
jgi:DNA adenine methylase